MSLQPERAIGQPRAPADRCRRPSAGPQVDSRSSRRTYWRSRSARQGSPARADGGTPDNVEPAGADAVSRPVMGRAGPGRRRGAVAQPDGLRRGPAPDVQFRRAVNAEVGYRPPVGARFVGHRVGFGSWAFRAAARERDARRGRQPPARHGQRRLVRPSTGDETGSATTRISTRSSVKRVFTNLAGRTRQDRWRRSCGSPRAPREPTGTRGSSHASARRRTAKPRHARHAAWCG